MDTSLAPKLSSTDDHFQPKLVLGITNPQTCLVLTGRLRTLREAGFQTTLVASPGELLERTAEREGVEAVSVPMQRQIAPGKDLRSLLHLLRLLRRRKPTLTEFSTPKAGLLGNVAAWMCRVPVRVYLLRGLKLETATGMKRQLLLMAERLSCACAHVVLCNSPSLRARAVALRLAPADKLRLLGAGSSNGVDIDHFFPADSAVRRMIGWTSQHRVIGFVGRLTRDKGVPELLDAFELILAEEPEARLLLVGWFDEAEDALEVHYRHRIRMHPQIHCTGFVADTAPWYRAMDVFVLPTWREGFPNAVLEAAATGLPVVTTMATGSRDSVIPEVTGLLIPPGHPEAIREAVMRLLNDRGRAVTMGQCGRAWVMENYVNRAVAMRTADFYWELIASKTATGSIPPPSVLV